MKLITTTLSFLLAVGLAGCVGEDSKPDAGKTPNTKKDDGGKKEAPVAAMTAKTLELAKDP